MQKNGPLAAPTYTAEDWCDTYLAMQKPCVYAERLAVAYQTLLEEYIEHGIDQDQAQAEGLHALEQLVYMLSYAETSTGYIGFSKILLCCDKAIEGGADDILIHWARQACSGLVGSAYRGDVEFFHVREMIDAIKIQYGEESLAYLLSEAIALNLIHYTRKQEQQTFLDHWALMVCEPEKFAEAFERYAAQEKNGTQEHIYDVCAHIWWLAMGVKLDCNTYLAQLPYTDGRAKLVSFINYPWNWDAMRPQVSTVIRPQWTYMQDHCRRNTDIEITNQNGMGVNENRMVEQLSIIAYLKALGADDAFFIGAASEDFMLGQLAQSTDWHIGDITIAMLLKQKRALPQRNVEIFRRALQGWHLSQRPSLEILRMIHWMYRVAGNSTQKKFLMPPVKSRGYVASCTRNVFNDLRILGAAASIMVR